MRMFFAKLAAFLALLTTAQVAIYHAGQKGSLFPMKAELDAELARGTRVIYFGDSVLRHNSPNDRDRRLISAMLEDLLPPGERVGLVARGASHMGLYLDFCDYLARVAHPPEVVVIPINLRSFSPGWDRRPGWQFAREGVILKLATSPVLAPFTKPLLTFRAFDLVPVTEDEFRRAVVWNGREPAGVMGDYDWDPAPPDPSHTIRIPGGPTIAASPRVRDQFLSSYMQPVTPEHRRLTAMIELIRRCRDRGIRPIFYTTPIDHQTGSTLLGPSFRENMRANVRLIASTLAAEGVAVVDLSSGVAAGGFKWPIEGYPNEHLNEIGRHYVARQLAGPVRSALSTPETATASRTSTARTRR